MLHPNLVQNNKILKVDNKITPSKILNHLQLMKLKINKLHNLYINYN